MHSIALPAKMPFLPLLLPLVKRTEAFLMLAPRFVGLHQMLTCRKIALIRSLCSVGRPCRRDPNSVYWVFRPRLRNSKVSRRNLLRPTAKLQILDQKVP